MLAELIQEYRDQIKNSRKGIYDVFISILPQGVALVTGLITSILIARGLGPAELGKYALVISVSAMITSLSDLGIGQTAIRYAARCVANHDEAGHRAVLRWAFRIRIMLVLAVSCATFFLSPFLAQQFWHDENLSPLIRLSLTIGLLGVAASVPIIYFQSLKLFRANAGVMIFQALTLMAGIVLLELFQAWALQWVIIVSIVSYAVNASAILILVPKDSIFKWSDFAYLKHGAINYVKSPKFKNYSAETPDDATATVFAFFMMLSAGIVMLVVKADIWLMGYFLEPRQIGIYSAASRFALPLMMAVSAMSTVLWPRMSNLREQPGVMKFVRGIFLLSGLAAFSGLGYAVIAPLFIPFVFGDEYAGGILLGQLLCFRFCLSMFLSPVGIVGYSFGFVRFIWLINILQLIAVVGINIWLLPIYGPIGGALALIAAEVIGGAFTIPVLWHKLKRFQLTQ